MSRTGRIVSRLAALILAVGLGLAVLELGAGAILFAREGSWSSARTRFERTPNRYVAEVTGAQRDCHYSDTLFPHPYLGWVHHRNPPCGIPDDINNIGLFGPEFPLEPLPDRFVVLITGGSVAAQFGQLSARGPRYLEQILNERYQSPKGTGFLVLNGGDGAWKQPQQTILFAIHANVVDGVATLDGYNEYFSLGGRKRFEAPAANFQDVNPVASSNFAAVATSWIVAELTREVRESPLLSRSNLMYLALDSARQAALKYQVRADRSRTNVDSLFALDPEGDWDRERRFHWHMEQYQKFIREMKAIADEFGVRSAFFIQPVPAIGKPLSEAERRVVGDLDYAERYRRMADGLLELRERGIAVFSLLDVFAGHGGTLYSDTIHLERAPDGSSEGYRLLAEAMAPQLAQAWGLKPREGAAPSPDRAP
jgi:hypothetical protein